MEAAVQKDDCFSIPHRSLIAYDNYISYRNYLPYNFGFDNLRADFMTFRLTFITCENPVLSPPDYIVDASSCKNGNSIALNGFELSWYSACCDSVNEIQYCNYDSTYCDSYGLNGAPIRVAIDFSD
nr:uncharacterized protein LOC118035426 [Populus alba]XP_034896880.1 uncharacterized protein LOC118035426 [Populus alba]